MTTATLIPVTLINDQSTYEKDAEIHPDTKIKEMVERALKDEKPDTDLSAITGMDVFVEDTGERLEPDMTIGEAGVEPDSVIKYNVKMTGAR